MEHVLSATLEQESLPSSLVQVGAPSCSWLTYIPAPMQARSKRSRYASSWTRRSSHVNAGRTSSSPQQQQQPLSPDWATTVTATPRSPTTTTTAMTWGASFGGATPLAGVTPHSLAAQVRQYWPC